MLFIPEEIANRLEELTQGVGADPVGTANRMLEVWPSSGHARQVLGAYAAKTGDLDRAALLFWEALNLEPCRATPYFALAAILTERDKGDVITKRLHHLALWKLAVSSSIPELIASTFEALAGAEARNPRTYEVLAMAEDVAAKDVVDPPEVVERLRPFRLLSDLQRHAPLNLPRETLRAITDHAADCARLFHNALREWAADADALGDDALCLLVAILGEIGEADAVDDLLELTDHENETLSLHANWAIFRLGQRFPAEVLKRFRALRPDRLPREQRWWLKEVMSAEDGLISMAEHLRIDEMDIEDICLRRSLLEEEEEDEEDFEEENLRIVPPRPGRNDPCWCGSGKKYKKCHLVSDEEEDRSRKAAIVPDEEPVSLRLLVMHEVMSASKEWHRKSDLRRATQMYFDTEEEDIEADDEEAARFSEWLLLDFQDAHTRHTAVENYLRTRATKLTRPEREMLESFRDSRYSVYQVKSIEPGSGLHLQDLCTGEMLFVHDAAGEYAEGDAMAARLQHLEGRYVFAGEWLAIPQESAAKLMPILEEESRTAGEELAKYVRGQAHWLHRLVKELAEDGIQEP